MNIICAQFKSSAHGKVYTSPMPSCVSVDVDVHVCPWQSIKYKVKGDTHEMASNERVFSLVDSTYATFTWAKM